MEVHLEGCGLGHLAQKIAQFHSSEAGADRGLQQGWCLGGWLSGWQDA